MGRAQDLLEKAMNNMKDLSENSDFGERINSGLDKLDAQKDKFFFQSLAGLPSANMLFKATEKMTSDESEKVIRLARVFLESMDIFKDETKVATWLKKPNRSLESRSPISFLDSDIGAEGVLAVLGRIRDGVYNWLYGV